MRLVSYGARDLIITKYSDNEYFVQDDNPPSSNVLDLAYKAVSTDLAYITEQGFSKQNYMCNVINRTICDFLTD